MLMNGIRCVGPLNFRSSQEIHRCGPSEQSMSSQELHKDVPSPPAHTLGRGDRSTGIHGRPIATIELRRFGTVNVVAQRDVWLRGRQRLMM